MNRWDKLSMADRAKYIKLAVENGITELAEIRNTYNSYAEGGFTSGANVNAIYEAASEVEELGYPTHKYDFTQSEKWADAHGYFPDKRGHRDDRVKKPAHPTHPSRGTWNGDSFHLTELGMKDPNYIMFGMADGGQDPQATLYYDGAVVLPEFTVTPKGNYIHNSYDNLNIKFAEGGDLGSSKHPVTLPELVVTPQSVALARSRKARRPNADFSHAQDMTEMQRFGANHLAGVPIIGTDPHTCLNTVTGFYDSNNTVAANIHMVAHPEDYGYKEIPQKEAIPGDLIILSNKDNHPTHAVMFDKVAKKAGTHRGYPIEVGDTLVNYSNGGRGNSDYRIQGPLPRFDDPEKAGGDFSGTHRYYRYVGKKKAKESSKNK